MRQPEPGASPHREAAEPACREARASRRLRGLWFDGVWPQGVAQHVGAFVWLGFILFPAINAFAKHGTALHHGLTIAAAAVFVTLYIALVMLWRARGADRALPVMFVGLVAIAIALTLADANGWGFLFTYCAACAGMMSRRFGFIGVLACAVLAGVSSAAGGATGGQVIGWVASSAGIGMLVLVMGDLRLRNEQLSAARAEMARMAVAQERERFARDLHDLLGHSLSVIALKAELAGRVLTEGARADASGAGAGDGSARERRSEAIAIEADMLERAATEVRELEQVARTALGEVREAVSGYRQPTLAGELAGARMALSAAGIEAEVQQTQVSLDPGVEAVLAWTVREGATNVIRHSGARHCTLRITASLTDAGVEVIDDGVGDSSREGRAGAPRASRVGAPGAGHVGAAGVGRAGALDVSRAPDGGRAGAADARRAPDGIRAGAAGHAASVNAGAHTDAAAAGLGAATANGVSGHDLAGLGAATADGISGHGLAGLAERARLLNGVVEAGPRPGGGYRLAVTVPVSHA